MDPDSRFGRGYPPPPRDTRLALATTATVTARRRTGAPPPERPIPQGTCSSGKRAVSRAGPWGSSGMRECPATARCAAGGDRNCAMPASQSTCPSSLPSGARRRVALRKRARLSVARCAAGPHRLGRPERSSSRRGRRGRCGRRRRRPAAPDRRANRRVDSRSGEPDCTKRPSHPRPRRTAVTWCCGRQFDDGRCSRSWVAGSALRMRVSHVARGGRRFRA